MTSVVCTFCDQPVDPADPWVWRRVTGWERKAISASRKGGSDIVLREQLPDGFACSTCVARLQAGVSTKQGTLL